MFERIPQSTTKRVIFKAFLSSDHVSAATGKTIAVKISKNAAAFADPSAGATNATEIASGWYYADLSTTDAGTLGPLIVRGTEATIDPAEVAFTVVDADTGGLGNLDAAISTTASQTSVDIIAGYVDTEVAAIKAKTDNLPASFPTNFADLAVEASTGRVKVQSSLAKGAETTVRFLMKDSTNHAPATGLTVAVEVSTDGGAFASATNSAVEEGNGWYAITLTTTEFNGDEIALHCTATGADDTEVNIRTDP